MSVRVVRNSAEIQDGGFIPETISLIQVRLQSPTPHCFQAESGKTVRNEFTRRGDWCDNGFSALNSNRGNANERVRGLTGWTTALDWELTWSDGVTAEYPATSSVLGKWLATRYAVRREN